MTIQRTWFISGCSSGLGLALSESVLQAGDRAVMTARKLDSIQDLSRRFERDALCLELDVTRPEQIGCSVRRAFDHFGRVDILVNNAGVGMVGAVEETSDERARRIFDVNFFGLLNLTREFLPRFRAQGGGHVINISSIAGLVGTAGFGIYNATKFAVEGLSEALAEEVAELNIVMTIVEPGPFRTEFLGSSMSILPEMEPYQATVGPTRRYVTDFNGKQPGDPRRAAEAIRQAALSDRPPLRLPLGKVTLNRASQKIESLRASLEDWAYVARNADFEK